MTDQHNTTPSAATLQERNRQIRDGDRVVTLTPLYIVEEWQGATYSWVPLSHHACLRSAQSLAAFAAKKGPVRTRNGEHLRIRETYISDYGMEEPAKAKLWGALRDLRRDHPETIYGEDGSTSVNFFTPFTPD